MKTAIRAITWRIGKRACSPTTRRQVGSGGAAAIGGTGVSRVFTSCPLGVVAELGAEDDGEDQGEPVDHLQPRRRDLHREQEALDQVDHRGPDRRARRPRLSPTSSCAEPGPGPPELTSPLRAKPPIAAKSPPSA